MSMMIARAKEQISAVKMKTKNIREGLFTKMKYKVITELNVRTTLGECPIWSKKKCFVLR